jgi:DNA-binding GntR family transcriptional regulator
MGESSTVSKLTPSGSTKRTPKARLQLKPNARLVKQQPPLLHERAADVMRNMIIEGEILPGSRMPEMELCDMLGISRTPLREALKVLASEGLLVLTPQRGAMVTEPDVERLDATVEAVAHIEAAAARIACRKASDRELQAIASLYKQEVEAAAAGNAKRYFRINLEFHGAIVRASHNEVLVETHTRVNAHLMRQRYQTVGQTSDKLRASFIAQHGAIVEALRERDAEAADRAILRHLSRVGEFAERNDSSSM